MSPLAHLVTLFKNPLALGIVSFEFLTSIALADLRLGRQSTTFPWNGFILQ